MKNWLYNSNVIVTGSSSGIGLEITKILIKKFNCNVLGVARNEEKLKSQQTFFADFKDKFSYFVADVSKAEDWIRLKDFLLDNSYNIIINNAGTMPPFLKAQNIPFEETERIFNTNFFSTVHCVNALFDYISSQKNGAIINNCSAGALFSVPGQSIYSSSKSALVSYSKILNSENKKVFVGTYLPGFTLTNIFFSKDCKKEVFDEKSMKIIRRFCTSAPKMAEKIVDAMKKRKPYKVLGNDAKLLRFLGKFAPVKSAKIVGWLFEKTRLSCFDDLNREEMPSKEL